jgi:Terminase RNaseH-like domain
VAIDPAVTSGEDADETGIIVVGRGADDRGYVLEDRSGRYTPDEWGRQAIIVYHKWKADRVVAEINQGGDMVENVLPTVDVNIPYKAVHAWRGKIARAEPVAALYEQRRVSHVGMWPALEDQMVSFVSDMPRKNGSPDRCDAFWGLTEVLVEHNSFDHAMATMTALYGENLAPATGDRWIDNGLLKPTQDNGARVKLRAPAGTGTVYGCTSGKAYQVDGDGVVSMLPEDPNHHALKSWERVLTDA